MPVRTPIRLPETLRVSMRAGARSLGGTRDDTAVSLQLNLRAGGFQLFLRFFRHFFLGTLHDYFRGGFNQILRFF